ncbi:hypothetical protein ACSBR1_029786 [Camellia fascicularis]
MKMRAPVGEGSGGAILAASGAPPPPILSRFINEKEKMARSVQIGGGCHKSGAFSSTVDELILFSPLTSPSLSRRRKKEP